MHEMNQNSTLGKEIKASLRVGKKIDTDLVLEIIQRMITSPKCMKQGYIIDVIPSLSDFALPITKQIEFLKSLKNGPEYIIELSVSSVVLVMYFRYGVTKSIPVVLSYYEKLQLSCCSSILYVYSLVYKFCKLQKILDKIIGVKPLWLGQRFDQGHDRWNLWCCSHALWPRLITLCSLVSLQMKTVTRTF